MSGFWDLQSAASTLLSFIDVSGSSASTEERVTAVVGTIMEAGASNRLNPGFFLSELRRRLLKLETRPQHKYVVIGFLSLASSLRPTTTRRINGVHIAIGASIARYRQERASIAASDRVFQDTPPSYTPIKLTVTARSDHEALSQSHKALSLLLGWWNHALTYGRSRYSMGGRPGPVAEIVLAPLRTLHAPSGRSLNHWYYDPDFAKYPRPFARSDQWTHLQKAEKSVRNKLTGHRYQGLLENATLAYYTACSCHMLENAFLGLWTLLETLTGTDQGDTLIRRTLFPIVQKHYDLCSWELRHLLYYRNCYIHRGDTRSDIQRLVYQLKGYVDILLKWWLFNFGKLRDKQEVFDLLDTPRGAKRISQHIQVLKHALKHAEKAGR
ncbi:MAG: hypothetical protein KAV00_00620 [Phycisphaerae bacterium]|nr:hypothetical protein [Phycisphaerae bacterium]